MSAPLSPPITYQQALEQAAAQIAQLKTPKPSAEQAVIATAAAANTIIAARDRASEHAKQAIHQLWLAVNPYDETAVAAFAAQAARIMMAAQQAAAKAAAVGQAHQLAAVGVKAAAVQSVPLDVRAPAAVIKNGLLVLRQHAVSVDYAEGSAKVSTADMTTQGVFKRPAAVYRYAKSKGATDVQAQALAGQRIDDLVDDNLMLAQRLAQQQVLAAAAEPVNLDGRPKAKTKIIGYRRVIHPELSYGGTCGMCIAASDRIYYVAELLPIHAHCKCTIAAITEDYDPADDLNAVDLNQLYKDAGGTSVAHLKRTRYKVDQHGELGSVMVPKSKYKPQTTKSKVRVGGTALLDDQPAQAEVAKQQLRVLEDNLARMRSEGEPEDSSKIAYHEKLIAKLRKQASENEDAEPAGAGKSGRTRGSSTANTDEQAPEPAAGTSGGGGGGNRGGGGRTGFGDPGDDLPFDRGDIQATYGTWVHIWNGDDRGGKHDPFEGPFEENKTLFPKRWFGPDEDNPDYEAAQSEIMQALHQAPAIVEFAAADRWSVVTLHDGVVTRHFVKLVDGAPVMDAAWPLSGNGVGIVRSTNPLRIELVGPAQFPPRARKD
ncbi:hypothetical protein [Mycolicibacterium peregrinum]|uniref:Uncharacterized protein n=1 Tax=Mycolicibacterium peregrinum TaxID=43304 RepID=A0A4Z0HMK1_MYCPR|nr:hypothetical protein [Mycolicibacterium peregrinum]TGB37883.1 hypothetical protein EJD98_25370 [Mycolicibacterium peregrinum]TGB38098.1 hypothetical protein EJD94_25195 [Mycolicibacterium peregrinum]